MKYPKEKLLELLPYIDLGSSIAEQDQLLEAARVETSVFSDLLLDKVDLIPGTKGSGKSALYRIFVEFLPDLLLQQKKVVIAHGVNRHGDNVFHAFKDKFVKLDEDDFVSFWCIYIISLFDEQFIKNPRYAENISHCKREIDAFRNTSRQAQIPDIKGKKSLRDILEWSLSVLKKIKLTYKLPERAGEIELHLFEEPKVPKDIDKNKKNDNLPRYADKIKNNLDILLEKSDLSAWLMIDRLDEIFPRRSKLERRALRGLLRTMRIFGSDRIRLKIFLRDDILSEVVRGEEGFTALTHITARQSDTLRWSEDDIMTMIVKRLFSHDNLRDYLNVDKSRLDANFQYRMEAFYKVFPPQIHKGKHQSPTIRWIYNHIKDGNNVVTPRDAIDLLSKAIQQQHSIFKSNPSGESPWIIDSQAIQYGFSELSVRKRDTYLHAEFPHLRQYIDKFIGGKTEYTERAIRKLLGEEWREIVSDLISIGLISISKVSDKPSYSIPHVYRKGLELTQGRAD